MNYLTRITACMTLLSSFASSENTDNVRSENTNKSVQLHINNWEEKMTGVHTMLWMVSDACRYCKTVRPEWEKLAEEYADNEDVIIAEINCSTEKGEELCDDWEVDYYPSFFYFLDGDKEGDYYSDGRDFASMKRFIETKFFGQGEEL